MALRYRIKNTLALLKNLGLPIFVTMYTFPALADSYATARLRPHCSELLGAGATKENLASEIDLKLAEQIRAWVWGVNADWSGNSPIPTFSDLSLTLSDDVHPIPTNIYFSIRSIRDLPPDLKRLIKSLKESSMPLTVQESEMGAIVARYARGPAKGIRFTSRNLTNIYGSDITEAINRSGIFPSKEIKSVNQVISLHTHPDFGNKLFGGSSRVILPSIDDYEIWLNLRKQLRSRHPNVAFNALVIPTGAQVSDIVFEITDKHLDLYRDSKKR